MMRMCILFNHVVFKHFATCIYICMSCVYIILWLWSFYRYTKLGFAGNTEPQFIMPSGEEIL